MQHNLTKKIAFLDRDGVINKKAEDHQYITSKKDFIFNEAIFDVALKLHKEGYEFIIITNQRGIARGLLTHETLDQIHHYIKETFLSRGIPILDILYCPHEIDSCTCRKPSPGMLEIASKKYSINLSRSLLISDSQEDITMGELFGIEENILVQADHPEDFFSKRKIKVAFIKYGGLTSGGSEKLLQIIAANLPKEKFKVTYFYCDPSPYKGGESPSSTTDSFREKYMLEHKVHLVKFETAYKDITVPTHKWLGTNFFEVFNEDDYDIIQTCRSGHKEFPFTQIKKKPIVDIIALSSGSDNQYNISRVLHLSAFSAVKWIQRGGDKKRIRYTSLPISTNEDTGATLTLLLGLKGKLVFGMHQRADNSIFSPIPLLAYSKIESATTTFLLLGGGDAYKQQAKELGLKNVHFLEATGDSSFIFKFLRTLSVYAHGRKDGEINSQAIAEAMYVGLPIVSHFSEINNGHVECIGDAGKVVSTVDEYQEELYKLLSNSKYLSFRKKNSLQIFKDNYEFSGQIKKYVGIYEDVYNNPYPNSLRRFATSLHYTQNIRVVLFYIYLKIKYALLKKS